MSKYGARKVQINGIVFDSRIEARRYQELRLLERAGQIRNLRRQVPYELIPAQYEPSNEVYKKGANKGQPKRGKCIEQAVTYIADFCYEENGKTVVEDTKGVKTKDYIIKRKLMLYVHKIRIVEICHVR